MTTDFRALCSELVALLDCFGSTFNIPIEAPVVTRARAALAEQPVAPTPLPGDAEGLAEVFWGRYAQPEPEGPTDQDLATLWNRCGTFDECEYHNGNIFKYARAVLARWGNYQVSLASSTQPLPEQEVEG
jgi:hypothetical protein